MLSRGKTNDAAAVDQKRRWKCDPTLFAGIEKTPTSDYLTAYVGKNGELDSQIAAHCRRPFRRIHRHRDYFDPGLLEKLITFGVIRQLAKAEWSPVPAIKDHDARPFPCKLG